MRYTPTPQERADMRSMTVERLMWAVRREVLSERFERHYRSSDVQEAVRDLRESLPHATPEMQEALEEFYHPAAVAYGMVQDQRPLDQTLARTRRMCREHDIPPSIAARLERHRATKYFVLRPGMELLSRAHSAGGWDNFLEEVVQDAATLTVFPAAGAYIGWHEMLEANLERILRDSATANGSSSMLLSMLRHEQRMMSRVLSLEVERLYGTTR